MYGNDSTQSVSVVSSVNNNENANTNTAVPVSVAVAVTVAGVDNANVVANLFNFNASCVDDEVVVVKNFQSAAAKPS